MGALLPIRRHRRRRLRPVTTDGPRRTCHASLQGGTVNLAFIAAAGIAISYGLATVLQSVG
ncbi:MAG: hypothetical protein KDB83_08060, partial [Actinobacteria bacterium]|nr:hypothetical protein [Actinomycetota bacterium]